MALLTAITPTAAGIAWSPVAVSASDTIAATDLGQKGCYLVVINGGASPDTVTVVDGGSSPASNPGTSLTNSVTNATTEVMFIPPTVVNLGTQLATINHSFTTTVTCVLIRIPG